MDYKKEINNYEDKRKIFIKEWVLYGMFGLHRIKRGYKKTGYLYLVSLLIIVLLMLEPLFSIILNGSHGFSYIGLFIKIIVIFVLGSVISICWIIDFFIFTKPIDVKIQKLKEEELIATIDRIKNKNK